MDFSTLKNDGFSFDKLSYENKRMIAHLITRMEDAKAQGDGHLAELRSRLLKKIKDRNNRNAWDILYRPYD